MTDTNELARRKRPLNLAIVHVDPDALVAHYLPWLEITSFLTALRRGETTVPTDGQTPGLTAQQLAGGALHKIATSTTAKCGAIERLMICRA